MMQTQLFLVFLSVCSYVCLAASENGRLINITRTDVQKKCTILFQLQATEKNVEHCKVFKSALEDSTEHSGPFNVDLAYHAQHITIPMIQAFFQLAEDTNPHQVPGTCTQNTGLMELAEKLDASKTLRNTIASISFTENVYDTLYIAALNKKNFWSRKSDINLEKDSAQKWFMDCIARAPDEQKFVWRKKLYPLQYSSVLFVALKNKVVGALKKIDPEKRQDFNTLPEFIAWQDSFLHRAYCAAKPLSAISSQLFQNSEKMCRWERKELVNPAWRKYTLSCVQCNKVIAVDEQLPWDREKNGIGCDDCIKQFLNGNVVDLSDCYNLDSESLAALISSNPHKYEQSFVHLPQIHLPLLELLVHYNSVQYRPHMGSYCWVNFGNEVVELDPVDIQGLSLFHMPRYVGAGYRGWMFCTFIITTKNNVSLLKRELSRLRKKENFYIKFIAPDATIQDSYDPHNDGHRWQENVYGSVWANNWPLRGALALVGLYCIYKLIGKAAHYLAWSSQDAYNKELPAYMTQLNLCASQIPKRTQSIAGYLATTRQPINISLPAEFKAPTFTDNPTTITLPDITSAVQAAQKLNQIKCLDRPVGFGFWAGAITIGAIFLNSIICSWTDFRYLFPFTWPIINACRIAVVKPYRDPAKNA